MSLLNVNRRFESFMLMQHGPLFEDLSKPFRDGLVETALGCLSSRFARGLTPGACFIAIMHAELTRLRGTYLSKISTASIRENFYRRCLCEIFVEKSDA